MNNVNGYVLENIQTGVWKTFMGSVQVFTNHKIAKYVLDKGTANPKEWTIVRAKIVRDDSEIS